MAVRHTVLGPERLLSAGIVAVDRESVDLVFGSGDRPADVLLPALPLLSTPELDSSRPTCLDFAVTHTQQLSSLLRASVSVGAAAS